MQLFLAMANKKLTSLLARPTKALQANCQNSCNDFKWLEWEFVVREFLTISRYKGTSPGHPKTDPWIWYNYMYWRIFPPASFDGPRNFRFGDMRQLSDNHSNSFGALFLAKKANA